MASIDTAYPDAGPSRVMKETGAATGSAAAAAADVGPAAAPVLAAYRTGRSEAERTADLLAFAVASERGLPQTPDAVERARREADAMLGDHALRYLHNHVEHIRQEAITEHLGRFRPPPGFPRLVAANLVALAIAGGLVAWLSARPEVRDALAGLFGG
jgi:hypothetical protein